MKFHLSQRVKTTALSTLFTLIALASFSQLDNYAVRRPAPNCACYINIIGGTGTVEATSWHLDNNLNNARFIGFSFI